MYVTARPRFSSGSRVEMPELTIQVRRHTSGEQPPGRNGQRTTEVDFARQLANCSNKGRLGRARRRTHAGDGSPMKHAHPILTSGPIKS